MAWTFADSQTIVVGRQSPAHLRLFDEPAISRRHLELRLDPPRAELADLGSSNGTLVNGIRVLSASLGHEDRIQIGQTELMFEVIGQSEFGTAASSTNKAIADRRDDETIDVAIGSPPGPTFNQSAASNKEVCATPGFAAAALMASATDMSDHTMLASQVPIEVGSYRLERLIGQGGMSTVHLATHKQTGEVFAVKLIHRDLANDGKPRRMFMREAALLTQLDHPRIVRAIEFGLQDDVPYLVMQYIDSLDLTQLLDTKPLAERIKIATWATFTILQAVHYLHDEGIVHRDIKPSNVLAYREGRHLKIKLADFGLAKCFDDSDHHNMTNERSLRGTLSFMAPEQMAN
jgi:serine/threonine-protein kinase